MIIIMCHLIPFCPQANYNQIKQCKQGVVSSNTTKHTDVTTELINSVGRVEEACLAGVSVLVRNCIDCAQSHDVILALEPIKCGLGGGLTIQTHTKKHTHTHTHTHRNTQTHTHTRKAPMVCSCSAVSGLSFSCSSLSSFPGSSSV